MICGALTFGFAALTLRCKPLPTHRSRQCAYIGDGITTPRNGRRESRLAQTAVKRNGGDAHQHNILCCGNAHLHGCRAPHHVSDAHGVPRGRAWGGLVNHVQRSRRLFFGIEKGSTAPSAAQRHNCLFKKRKYAACAGCLARILPRKITLSVVKTAADSSSGEPGTA